LDSYVWVSCGPLYKAFHSASIWHYQDGSCSQYTWTNHREIPDQHIHASPNLPYVQCPTSTVNDIVQRYRQTGEIESRGKRRSGRPRKLSLRVDRALGRQSVANPRQTAKQIQHAVGSPATTVSIATIKRTLIRMGRITQRPVSAPNLNSSQRRVRLNWCRRYSHWTEEEWQRVRYLKVN
jgi:hypothetical protein